MAARSTRQALLEEGALLFARHGVAAVTTRQLHDTVGARNESALHYHFGGRDGLVETILREHVAAVEARRAELVEAIGLAGDGEDGTGDVRTLVRALALPMAEHLITPLGRAHLRLVAQLSHPSLAYQRPFRLVEAPAGRAVARWLWQTLEHIPPAIRTERVAALRTQLLALMAQQAQLIDDLPPRGRQVVTPTGLFVENLIDMLVASLLVEPSPATQQAQRTPRSRPA